MYKIDIKDALYPIQIVLVVYKKFSKTSVFIDRKWPISFYSIIVFLFLFSKFYSYMRKVGPIIYSKTG